MWCVWLSFLVIVVAMHITEIVGIQESVVSLCLREGKPNAPFCTRRLRIYALMVCCELLLEETLGEFSTHMVHCIRILRESFCSGFWGHKSSHKRRPWWRSPFRRLVARCVGLGGDGRHLFAWLLFWCALQASVYFCWCRLISSNFAEISAANF